MNLQEMSLVDNRVARGSIIVLISSHLDTYQVTTGRYKIVKRGEKLRRKYCSPVTRTVVAAGLCDSLVSLHTHEE